MNSTEMPGLKVALLGDSATQFLATALKGAAFQNGWRLDLWEADFNQVERQTQDSDSELYRFAPEYVIVFQSTHKLLQKYNTMPAEQRTHLAQSRLDFVREIVRRIPSRVIYFNYPEIDDSVWGNFANKRNESFLFQTRALNFGLMQMAMEQPHLWIFDLAQLQAKCGRNFMFQASVYVNSDLVLSLEAIPWVAGGVMDMIAAQRAKFKKCLILDLDNTLWGGIIGDDGIENIQIGSLGIGKAFTEFQYWIKKLRQRGIILAVCSKNNEATAKAPFEQHPDMVLRLSDIAVFVANWNNKADNIRLIQSILNIGFDSMVFLDDNPVERAVVRQELPEVCVPELPEDPAEYLEYLYGLGLFETASYDSADADRTQQYQTEALRAQTQQAFTNEADFLASLEMVSRVEPLNGFNRPRIAQLSLRSNQFNLRTQRYSEQDLIRLQEDPGMRILSFTLTDKFGDHGLVAVVVIQARGKLAFIENWFMSCRVLKRGMEQFCLNVLAQEALDWGKEALIGEYLPTPKNDLVKDHYAALGFEPDDQTWRLDLKTYTPANVFIAKQA